MTEKELEELAEIIFPTYEEIKYVEGELNDTLQIISYYNYSL